MHYSGLCSTTENHSVIVHFQLYYENDLNRNINPLWIRVVSFIIVFQSLEYYRLSVKLTYSTLNTNGSCLLVSEADIFFSPDWFRESEKVAGRGGGRESEEA